MKQNKKKYESPIVETMNCNVEKGFSCSNYCDDQLESLTIGNEVNNLFN